MSFPRSRIRALLLRALLSPKNTADYQVKRPSHWGISDRQCLFFYWRFYPIVQLLLKRTWASLEIRRMASSVHKSPFHGSTGIEEIYNESSHISIKTAKVIFVLGGPGSGKGTQCALIVEQFGFTHLSAGDLLRAEINTGSENGVMIQSMIKEGKIVPSEVTVKLLQNAMLRSGNDKFLIDGFPRNDENRAAFELVVICLACAKYPEPLLCNACGMLTDTFLLLQTGIQPEFILFFDCTEKEMEKRLLGRNQGRVDDNIETIRKRFKVFVDSSLPVISHYGSFGKVRKIDADRTKEEVFQSLRPLFVPFLKEDKELATSF